MANDEDGQVVRRRRQEDRQQRSNNNLLTQKMMAKLRDNKAIVEFLDHFETESALIGMSIPDSASSETRKQNKAAAAAAANAKASRDEDIVEYF